MEGVQHADDVLALFGEERGCLSLLGELIPPGADRRLDRHWRGGQPAQMTLTKKERWHALVRYVLGCLSAWVSNESSLGIAPLNGIVVALVLAWWSSARSAKP